MKRIFELDVFRGIVIYIMISFDAPPSDIYAILLHAPWEGLTIADMAFPMFVFAMGMAAAVSSSRKVITWRKIFIRAAVLFLIGLIVNLIFFKLFGGELAYFRILGILQRLALTYALGMAIIKIFSDDKKILITAFSLLILYSLGFHVYAPENPFDESHNISGAIDFIFPGENHMLYPTHDPEGLYGTISTTSSMLFGFLAGRILINNSSSREKIYWMFIFAVALLVAGGLWSLTDIIAKRIWTAPFSLLTSGINALIMATLMYLIPLKSIFKKFFQPFIAFGKNPLFFFITSNIVFAYLITSGLWAQLFELTRFEFIDLQFNTLIFCLTWGVVWLFLAQFLDKFGIVIKI